MLERERERVELRLGVGKEYGIKDKV